MISGFIRGMFKRRAYVKVTHNVFDLIRTIHNGWEKTITSEEASNYVVQFIDKNEAAIDQIVSGIQAIDKKSVKDLLVMLSETFEGNRNRKYEESLVTQTLESAKDFMSELKRV